MVEREGVGRKEKMVKKNGYKLEGGASWRGSELEGE